MMLPRTALQAGALGALVLLSACDRSPVGVDREDRERDAAAPLGLIEVTISGIGDGAQGMSATAGPLALDVPGNGDGSGDGSIQLDHLSSGSFTEGARDGAGARYVYATFRVRNAQSDGAAYDTPRENLTFMAVSTASTLNGTAVSTLRRFDGSNADTGVASAILPTGLVRRTVDGSIGSRGPDVLQVITEGEAAAVDISGTTATGVFPYGFVARNASDDGRILPASPAEGEFHGVVTFAFRIPLQASAIDDPFTVSMMFLALDDSETRITQSLEEQGAAGQAAFEARAAAIGASTVTLLPRGQFAGGIDERTLCGVRTAGTSGDPDATLTECTVATVEVSPSSATHLVLENEPLTATLRDAAGEELDGLRITWHSSDESVAMVDANGLVRLVGEGTATITAASEGVIASATLTGENIVWETVTAGYDHSCGLTASGAAFCWGANGGRLGDGTTTSRTTRVRVKGGHTFVQIAAGGYHTVALTHAGAVYAWGHNGSGRLGDGTTTQRLEPVAVSMPGGVTFSQIHAGGGHTVALTAAGAAYGWGWNGYGQLGDGTTTDRHTPTVVSGGRTFSQISAGGSYTVALTGSGAAFAWGWNYYGQLGDGTSTDRHAPVAVSGGRTFSRISAGGGHTVALTAAGAAFAWGHNSYGQLGDGTVDWRYTPVAVSMPSGVTFSRIEAGSSHTLALAGSGAAYSWGLNQNRLGTGSWSGPETCSIWSGGWRGSWTHYPCSRSPVPVSMPDGVTFDQIQVGSNHSAGVTSSGAAWSWGVNDSGQLGDGTTTGRSAPVRMVGG